MPVESATYISGLNVNNPVGASDRVSSLDDHARLIKATLLNTFPNITGAMTASHAELNILDGATLSTAELNILDGVTATASELNALDGITANVSELNKLDGVGTLYHTGNIATLEGDVSHDNLVGFVANEHINHASVSITAGAGLTGGGTIAATRDIAVGAGSGITVNANDVAVDSTVVRTTGTQTIGGAKTFSSDTVMQSVEIQDAFITSGVITDDIGSTATLDDYAPTGIADASIIRVTHSATVALRGLTGGVSGRRVIIFNNDATAAININAENANSTAANRFALPAVSIAANESVEFWYDGTSNRWRSIAGE